MNQNKSINFGFVNAVSLMRVKCLASVRSICGLTLESTQRAASLNTRPPATMKFSTVFAAALVTVACVFSPAAAEKEASVHLRVHAKEAICYLSCPSGQYCENGTNSCRKPSYQTECFNPATGHYQNGCSPGFACKNNKCDYA